MIDPLLPTSSAMRLAALHSSGEKKKRQKPAHTSKIFTAGLSTTALLGMVAAMGWPSGSSAAQNAAPAEPNPAAVTPVVFALPAAPVTTAAPAPVTVAVPVTVATVPVTPAPTPAPVAVTPVVIPVAVPAPAAQPQVTKKKSHTTTKSSG